MQRYPLPCQPADKPAKTRLDDCLVAHKIDDELLLYGTGFSCLSRIVRVSLDCTAVPAALPEDVCAKVESG